MPRAYAVSSTSAPIGTGSSGWKTILLYTAPAQGAVITRNPVIEGDSVSSATAKYQTRIIRGGTGGVGTNAPPVAKGSNNPAGVSLGSAKENCSAEPTGYTALPVHLAPPYAPFVFPENNIVLVPNELIGIQVNCNPAINVTASFGEIET